MCKCDSTVTGKGLDTHTHTRARALNSKYQLPGYRREGVCVCVCVCVCVSQAGADANAHDRSDFTPVEVAIATENSKVADLLLSATEPIQGVEPWTMEGLTAHVHKKLGAMTSAGVCVHTHGRAHRHFSLGFCGCQE